MAASQGEIEYCVASVRNGLRLDGRAWNELRPVEIELGVIAAAAGSARVKLGGTDVVVAVKAEVGPPPSGRPTSGRLGVTVECSACASPEFEGRGGDAWGHALAAALENSLAPPGPPGKSGGLDLTPLCIIPGKAAWSLYVDALVLNDAGGVLSALSIAALSALTATRLPRVTVTKGGQKAMAMDGEGGGEGEEEGGDTPEIELEDDEGGEGVPLSGLSGVPLIVSVGVLGGLCVVDPGTLEEKAAATILHVAVNSAGAFAGMTQEGPRGLDIASLQAGLEAASSVAPQAIRQVTTFIASKAAS